MVKTLRASNEFCFILNITDFIIRLDCKNWIIYTNFKNMNKSIELSGIKTVWFKRKYQIICKMQ